MVERFLRFLRGYVEIFVCGGQPERFLNLIKSRQISLLNVCSLQPGKITAILSLKDFFRLRPIRNKTNVHIRVVKKCGMPFFFYRNRKRKAFFLGVVLSLLLMAGLSTRIWNIHIEGNQANTTQEILEFLKKSGVTHGMAKAKLNCGQIASLLRRQYPDIAWVSARIRGTRLILNIQEGLLTGEQKGEKQPCNLIAEKEGILVKMVTRKGVPLVHPGDRCEKGMLLVTGELPIFNDAKEVVRQEYVHADADIYIQSEIAYHRKFPLKYQTQLPTGKERTAFSIRLGRFYLEFSPGVSLGFSWKFRQSSPRKSETQLWKKTEAFFPLRITENFRLPITLGKAVFREYRPQTKIYTPEEARAQAVRMLQNYEETLLKKGIRISNNHVSVKITGNTCSSSGYLTVIEKIGQETPIFAKNQQKPTNISCKIRNSGL